MPNRNRPVRKRTNLVREEQLLQIAGMHLENLSQRVIAARLRLSQSQICRDLKEIKRRWQSAHRQELATLQAKEIARNEHIEQTAWAAWHKSCEPEETQSQEKSTTEGDAEDGCIASN